MRNLLTLILLISFVSCNSDRKTVESTVKSEIVNPEYLGIYGFKSAKSTESHYLTIDTLNGNYIGLYFGTEKGNENRILHFGNRLENLIIEKNKIQFEIGERNLYKSTLFRIVKHKSELANDSIIGVAKNRLKYKGVVLNGGFKLNCESEFQNCWVKELTFEKITP